MQSNYQRLLEPVFTRARIEERRAAIARQFFISGEKEGLHTFLTEELLIEEDGVEIPKGFSGISYLIFLLHIAAEIKHGAMLQHLYAAYSMDTPQIPEIYQLRVSSWQEVCLGIAKEEMRHLVLVQQALKLIGAPLYAEEQEHHPDTPCYPFSFRLEPLTPASVAKYVYAEAPADFLNSADPQAKEIKDRVAKETPKANMVDALFHVLLQLAEAPAVMNDAILRTDVYHTLSAIRANNSAVDEPSRFNRLLNVYREVCEVANEAGLFWQSKEAIPQWWDSLRPEMAPVILHPSMYKRLCRPQSLTD